MTGPAAEPDDDDEVLRRHFVAVATSEYDHAGWSALPGVKAEVEVLRGWLCNDALAGRRFIQVHEALAHSPTDADVRATLMRPDLRWNDGDAAVVFVTGHGLPKHRTHWLAFRNTSVDNLFGTAIDTSHLIGSLIGHNTRYGVAIFDLCYAGGAAAGTIGFDTPIPKGWLVLASASKHHTAKVGALTGVIADILAELSTEAGGVFGNEPYLDEVQFFTAVRDRLEVLGQDLVPLHHRFLASGSNPCLPNPRYRSNVAQVQQRRRDLAIRAEDLESHWDPRARGVTAISEAGWMFTGRAELMRTLIAAAQGPPGATVVTGRAGCGKSAALARLVTLSDPLFLARYADHVAAIPADLTPRVDAVDVAVLGTGKLAHELFAQILHSLDIAVTASAGTVPSLADLAAAWTGWIGRHTEPVTIVVDALDEATNPRSVLDDVLTVLAPPDSPHARVRLIVGVRSPGADDPPPGPGTAALADLVQTSLQATRLQADQTPLWNNDDVTVYVRSILTAPDDSPYRVADETLLDTVATQIAADAGSSFLIAGIAARSLSTRPAVVDVADPSWRGFVREGVVGVFRADLHTTLPDPGDRQRAVHLLRAVAFAYGRGLPWYQIWPRVANAVADGERFYGDADIAWLLGSRLGGYLVTDTEDDTTVYRLFHDTLRETLRNDWDDLLQTPR